MFRNNSDELTLSRRLPSGFPYISASRHGFTDFTETPHSAQRSLAESADSVSPIEIFGSQLIGRNRSTLHRGQKHSMCV
jgi:hypothetical protein